jgi:IS5 family transposase
MDAASTYIEIRLDEGEGQVHLVRLFALAHKQAAHLGHGLARLTDVLEDVGVDVARYRRHRRRRILENGCATTAFTATALAIW